MSAGAFRVFRVRATGPDSSGLHGLRLGGIELCALGAARARAW